MSLKRGGPCPRWGRESVLPLCWWENDLLPLTARGTCLGLNYLCQPLELKENLGTGRICLRFHNLEANLLIQKDGLTLNYREGKHKKQTKALQH